MRFEQLLVVDRAGIGPATSSLQMRHSTTELPAQILSLREECTTPLFSCKRYRVFKEFSVRRTDRLKHLRERRAGIQPGHGIHFEQIWFAVREDEIRARKVRHTERAMRRACCV